jgi:hypothetical protein
MHGSLLRLPFRSLAALLPVLISACLVAAAGAGAGGAVYFSERGAESLVTVPMDQARSAVGRTFQELGITETRSSTDREGTVERHRVEGTSDDREITVSLKPEGDGTRVEVVARRSAVTWDRDFARQILERIVQYTR